jgi:hypothetical protein
MRAAALMRHRVTRFAAACRRRPSRAGVAALAARVDALETSLAEQRQLALRIAQLTDIVQELLIPVADRDEERLHRLLERYAAEL